VKDRDSAAGGESDSSRGIGGIKLERIPHQKSPATNLLVIEVQPADLAEGKKHFIGGEPELLLSNRGGNTLKKHEAAEKERDWMRSREKNGSSRRKSGRSTHNNIGEGIYC